MLFYLEKNILANCLFHYDSCAFFSKTISMTAIVSAWELLHVSCDINILVIEATEVKTIENVPPLIQNLSCFTKI